MVKKRKSPKKKVLHAKGGRRPSRKSKSSKVKKMIALARKRKGKKKSKR